MSRIITLMTAAPQLPSNVTHTSTIWQIATDINFTNIIYEKQTSTDLYKHLVIVSSQYEVLYSRSKIILSIGELTWSEPSVCISPILPPVIHIDGYPNRVGISPIISTDPFQSLDPNQTHQSTDWIIYDKATNTIIWQSINDTTNLTSIKVPKGKLQPNKDYIVAVKFTSSNNLYSEVSTKQFTTVYTKIETPSFIFPNGNSNLTSTPRLTLTPFILLSGTDTHVETIWRIYTTGYQLVWELVSQTDLTTTKVPPFILQPNTQYVVTAQYIGQHTNSNVATDTITIANVFIEPPLFTVQGAPENVPLRPWIETYPFITTIGTDIHVSTDWIVMDDSGNTLWQSLNDTVNLTKIRVPDGILTTDTYYRIKVRHRGQVTVSEYTSMRIKTAVAVIAAPDVTVEGAPSDVPTGPTISASPFVVVTGLDTHIATDWRVKDTNGNIVWESIGNVANLTNISLPDGTLDNSTTYIFEVVYHGQSGAESDVGTTTATTVPARPPVVIEAPSVIVQGAPNNVPTGPRITASNFTVVTGSDLHVATDWIVKDNTTGNVVWQSLNDTANLNTIDVPNGTLTNSTTYIFEVVYHGQSGATSSPGRVVAVTVSATAPVTIEQPTIVVEGQPNNVPLGPTLFGSNFTVTSGIDTHVATDWIVKDSLGTVVWSSMYDTVNLTSITIPPGFLTAGTTYIFSVIYYGNSGVSSLPGSITATTLVPSTSGPPVVIATPTLTVQGEPNNVPTGPQLTGSAFTVTSGTDTHISTDWMIIDTTTSVTVWSSIGDTVNLTNITVPTGTLNSSTTYEFRVKYNGNTASSSFGSKTATTQVVPNTGPSTATIQTPTITETVSGNTRVYSLSPFTVISGNASVIGAEWNLINLNTNSVVESKFLGDGVDYTINNSMLTNGVAYRVSARYLSNNGNSDYATYDFTYNAGSVITYSNIWTVTDFIPIGTYLFSYSLLLDGRVLIVGGGDSFGEPINSYYIFDTQIGQWKAGSTTYPMRIGWQSQSTLSDGRVLVVGGFLDSIGNMTNKCYIYNPILDLSYPNPQNPWIPAADYPTPIAATNQTTLPDGRVLVVGGRLSNGLTTNKCYIYNPVTNSWLPAADCPVNIDSHGQTLLLDGRVMVAGGINNVNSGPSSSCYIYDPTTDTWSPAASLPIAVNDLRMSTLSDGRVMLTGGWSGLYLTTGTVNQDAYVYDPGTNSWSVLISLPGPRHSHGQVTLQDGTVFIFGGKETATGILRSCYIYS